MSQMYEQRERFTIKDQCLPLNAPNLFIIGAPKCGTTHVVHSLSEHGQVFVPYPKETGFWATDMRRPETVSNINTLDDYLSLYSSAQAQHKYLIDGSVIYLSSPLAVSNILEFDAHAKFVIMLRNPVEQVQSWHREQVFNFNENVTDFWEAWLLQDERARGESLPPRVTEPLRIQYASYCALGDQLGDVVKIIPSEQLFIGFLDDLHDDPVAFYSELQSFLGLTPDSIGTSGAVKSRHEHRYPLLASWYQKPPKTLTPMVRQAKKVLRSNKNILKWVKRLLAKKSSSYELSEDQRKALHTAFDPQTQKIEAITGRDLTHWKLR